MLISAYYVIYLYVTTTNADISLTITNDDISLLRNIYIYVTITMMISADG